ncbi:efflux RND transporter permease subunit [Candidatus Thiosymbion oneisti]|uniref:efflux RND transporter permease subunit n=1 Tax=Candidatus Thiosymbion oneisti TaxID=589554 RepID=UPI000B0C08F1|nr:MMPL family transporter [Candidatus Thiosymbion oneisti]
MLNKLTDLYYRLTLDRPLSVLFWVALFMAVAAYCAQGFKLDASADSLILENDEDLRYYRGVLARYGSDEFLVVAYSPRADLMSDQVLADIGELRDELAALEQVESVTTLLDVPLMDSPRVTLSEIRKEQRTLETPGTDRELARQELTTSPLYRNLVVSPDGRTTAMRVSLHRDEQYRRLLERREALRLEQSQRALSPEESAELQAVSEDFKAHAARLQDQRQADIASVRAVLDRHRDMAEIYLGGIPMIASDMIDYVRNDIRVFGVGVALFLIGLLGVAFKRLRWILIPLLICAAAAVGMMGFLGLMDWRVTVVSSNFISLMLITALALTVHMVVRYLELQTLNPQSGQRVLVKETIRSKFLPSLYTALTTQVAFASLIISGIRPVIDFGWMMVVGVGLAFVLCFLLFPTSAVQLTPGKPVFRHHDVTAAITRSLARLIKGFRTPTLWVYALLVALSVAGLLRLTVENRFIDYFKDSTEIYRGMLLIDRQLGGTTPLDVIVGPDRTFLEMIAEEEIAKEKPTDSDEFEADPLYQDELSEDESTGISGDSYWFNMFQLPVADQIHAYLEGLPETGKVLSISTTMALATLINNGPLDNLSLAVLYQRLPENIRNTLFTPYMSADGNQLRFSVRVIDSDPDLQRDELIKRIRKDLVDKLGLEATQVRLSGMLVLYNNVLQSLFRSQILTLVVVFLAIGAMLLILFRNWMLAAIGSVPTMVAATVILGTMGWLGIPLDIMTITIAAISIGIGVDNTIHYTHRVREEFARDGDYWAAVERSHGSVGRAIYYTSITVTLGFSILVLSNFIPTIYFGLLTGLAMLIALIANLTLLPLLIVRFKPLGPENS